MKGSSLFLTILRYVSPSYLLDSFKKASVDDHPPESQTANDAHLLCLAFERQRCFTNRNVLNSVTLL